MANDVPLFEGPDFGPEEEEVDEEEEELEPEAEEASGDDEGNRVSGGTARSVLEHVARSIVEDPDAVFIDSVPARNGLRFELHVAPGDMGRIIGKRGRVAQALRSLIRAAAAKDGTDASIDIVD
ncbi:MAG: KH domain-containing protein [Acidimicrobiales bacterium]